MGRKRKPSAYQKQIWFLTVFFGVIMIVVVVGILLLLSKPVGGYNWFSRIGH